VRRRRHVEFSAWTPRLATRAGERPRASAVARDEITRTTHVTTLRHETLRIDDPLGAALLRLLDGTRDRAMLVEELVTLLESGRIALPGDSDGDVRVTITNGLENSLIGLGRSALLEA
jgi:hypothetical protein